MELRNSHLDVAVEPETDFSPEEFLDLEAAETYDPAGAYADHDLVQQCLAGEEHAWERMYARFHPPLLKAIEFMLGRNARDVHLIDEIAARVWYSLLRDGARLLSRFDPELELRLATYLRGLARIEIMRNARAERRRISHELLGGRRILEDHRFSDWQLSAAVDEFAATLTPREQEFMEKFLLTMPGHELDGAVPKGNGDGRRNGCDAAHADISPSNMWQRRHRIRFKLKAFFDEYRGKE
jgi:hypothetical protein